jgi:hypothetical protein
MRRVVASVTLLVVALLALAGADRAAASDLTPEWTDALARYAMDPATGSRAILRLGSAAPDSLAPFPLVAAADANLRAGRPRQAGRLFEALLARELGEPWAGWARLGIGWSALTTGDEQRARAELTTLANLSPTRRPTALVGLGLRRARTLRPRRRGGGVPRGRSGRQGRSEDTLGRYEQYFGAGWLDAFVSAAIAGTGPFAGESHAVRRQGVQKGIRNQILVAWVLHELDAAVEKAKNGNFSIAKGAPHNWDEVRAYYYGEKPECAPYATADERGGEFGTGPAVNEDILAAMRQGLAALEGKNAAASAKARDEVVPQITVTYLQSAIKYSAAIDAALAQGKVDEARVWQAEGWAYFRVIEPLVARVNVPAARTVAEVFDLKARPAQGSGEKVAGALAKIYDALGIRSADVGKYRAS